MNVTIESISATSVAFDSHLSQSRISPIFLALNSSLSPSNPAGSAPWLSVTAIYHSQTYSTFLEFLIDYTLPPTIDVVLGVDFLDKCRTHIPALSSMFIDEGSRGGLWSASNFLQVPPLPVYSAGAGTVLSGSSLPSVSWSSTAASSTLAPSPVSSGGPDVVSTRSSTLWGGVDAVVSPETNPVHVNNAYMNNDNCDYHPRVNDCPVELPLDQKSMVVQFLVSNPRIKVSVLRAMCARHQNMVTRDSGGKRKSGVALRADFRTHTCTQACLVFNNEALLAGIHSARPLSEVEQQECRLMLSALIRKKPSSTQKRKRHSSPVVSRKQPRLSFESSASSSSPDIAFPIILPQSEKDQIVREFLESTGNSALKRYECSFCGTLENANVVKMRSRDSLDISLLEKAVNELREVTGQEAIVPYKHTSLINNSFVLCHLCNISVTRGVFKTLPVRSYANGLWIGEVPDELRGLSFLEEQCIARARATKCMYKLRLTSAGQFAARGNVCILPQDTSSFLKKMPPPISKIRDEICVILVGSPTAEITYDMLKKSPLLVRRKRIERALLWLIEHNPLYQDLNKSEVVDNLKEYPEYDCPLAVTEFLRTNSATNQGSSYTYTNEADDELFDEGNGKSELTSTTLVDVDNVGVTYKQRKLDALRMLKGQQAGFVKFPSGNVPLATTKNPRVFGWLWPVLFPYGVGMPDNNDIRSSAGFGFRDVDTAPHVEHLLSLGDRRFQVHKSFKFVLNNILQRRQSSFKSRLAAKRSWFPVIQRLLDKVDQASMDSYQAKLDKKESAFPKPDTEGEKAALQLMRLLSYVSDHIPGSVGDTNTMKQQIRSKIICDGPPHFFATVNPADSHNPIAQVLAGRDIDLDKMFESLDEPKKEAGTRARVVADNPVAGAEFFHLMVTKFFDIILGAKRVSKIGVLGKTQGWYAVVESQVRGSLHLHVLIWIHGAPASPLDMKERMNADPVFKERLTKWYDDVICQSFSKDSVSYVPCPDGAKQEPVMSRPLNPDSPDYEHKRDQHHRDICENCGLVHDHGAVCFKHIPRRIQSLIDPDEDCRFRLPRAEVEHTHFDDDGDLVLRCENGSLNGHNPTATLCLGCNTDLKQTASGPVAMTMIEYMCNYTAKLQLDTSIVFSALCSAIKALQDNPPVDPDGNVDSTEKSRRMFVKATNTLVGKRELTAQQTVSLLLGRKNRYTSDDYQEYWWSSMLRDIARGVFMDDLIGSPGLVHETERGNEEEEAEHDQRDEDLDSQRMIIPEDEDDSLILLSAETVDFHPPEELHDESEHEKRFSTLFCDIFYRPPELETTCAWDILRNYVKEKKPKSKNPRKMYLKFKPGHPQYTTHCLKRLDRPVIPVLMGYRVPRNDCESDAQKHAVTTLALFKPWSNEKISPLKPESVSWTDALDEFKNGITPEHTRILRNMQFLYQSKDAKFDYHAQRSKRLAELKRMARDSGVNLDEENDDEYDPVWENAMQTAVHTDDQDDIDIRLTPAMLDAENVVNHAKRAGFYAVAKGPSNTLRTQFEECSRVGDDDDKTHAEIETRKLSVEKDQLLKSRLKAAQQSEEQRSTFYHPPAERIPCALHTTLQEEADQVKELYERSHYGRQTDSPWTLLRPYQQLCFALVRKHKLNDEQTRAFLLMADKIGRDFEDRRKTPPLTLLCTGPGGTGKSVIFRAWKEFYEIIGHPERLQLTAPTGVVASDIGGCTIHSELGLRFTPAKMKSTPSLRTSLEERISPLETLILDEIYFLGAKDMARVSEYLGIATGDTESICGGLNFATCGDPCQLPPPVGKTLFDRELVNCHTNDNLNDLNENIRTDVKGLHVWHQIEHVVVLEEIMRQRGDPVLIETLKRLRKGNCTAVDKALLDKYVLTNPDCSPETKALTDIQRWINNPEKACPLIVYTNVARDRHNNDMAQAFATATGQECPIYYAKDTKGRGRKKRQLTGQAAEAAWSVPVKEANDLGGRVPYVAGMPVFCTENIATELGISNGSLGTLVSVTYEESDGRRYAISAEVDFKAYTNPTPNIQYPHRVTLKPVNKQIRYRLPGSESPYTATRWQLPLIPAFAFTSHNAQGRSLDVCCIDLASCPSIQSAYVMLSRVRSLNGLCILHPFDLRQIQSHISEELRKELSRVEQRAERTKEYSRERLSWFYNLVSGGEVSLLTNKGPETRDLDVEMASPAGSTE